MNTDKKIATRQSFGEALLKLGKENSNIIVLDADLSTATKTNLFANEFPNRFFNMGISEQDMISTASRICKLWKNSIYCNFCSICNWKSV